jgi:hypothetical protein
MDFEGDAFISYAHLDNVELVEGRKGWVANLHRALEIRVAQLLGKTPRIWRDPKLQGNDLFAETLVERLRHVALLVTVVSPRYVRSEWTQKELNEFWEAAERQGGLRVGDKARVFKVLKTPVPLDRTPPHLQSLLGYEFFKVDPETGKVRELDEVFGPDAQRDFWVKLDDLAHDIVDLLERLETEAELALRPEASQDAVYLADTTSDLRTEREAIKRELQQRGYLVLPARTTPLVYSDATAAIEGDLRRCRLSVHLVGRSYSLVPEGGTESLLELQHELAIQRGSAGHFSRIVWIPDGLNITDPRQAQVVSRLKLDPRTEKHADLLETSFEDLLPEIHEVLERSQAPEATAVSAEASQIVGSSLRLYVIHDHRDGELVAPWADALFERGLEVLRPLFEGDEADVREYHEDNLATCDGALIFYGAANELWLRRKLKELQKSAGYGRTKPAPAVGICLVTPKTPEKERFRTHDAMVIPQWEGPSLEALQPFLARLKPNV